MVCRLVRRRLLRLLSRTKSARAYPRWPPSLARWILAAPDQGRPHCGAIEYSARAQIHRLRFPSRAILKHMRLLPGSPRRHHSRTPTMNRAETEKRALRKVTHVMPIGAEGQAEGEIAGPFRGPRAIDGSPRVAGRQRCQRRPPDIRPDGARPIATEKWFRRSCRVENGEKKQRSESGPAETSFPALARRATPIPSVRGPRRKRLNESSADLRVSLHASNRVTCGGGNMHPFRPCGILPVRGAPGPIRAMPEQTLVPVVGQHGVNRPTYDRNFPHPDLGTAP